MMADVFISYSKSYVTLTRDLAHEIEANGFTVWWDTELLAGESFRERITQELQACKAAIVIWTPDSIHSPYVISEAERARIAGKLIQVRTADVRAAELPPPFDTSHAPLIEDRKAIFGALARLAIPGSEAKVQFSTSPSCSDHVAALRRISVGRRAVATLVAFTFIAIVALAATNTEIVDRFHMMSLVGAKKQAEVETKRNADQHEATNRKPASLGLASDQGGRALTIATRFFDEVNAGLRDSSLFDKDVRLGRRGVMNKVEAIGELRKVWLIYRKINCRMESDTLTFKSSRFSDIGFRVKVFTECDFVDQAGLAKTERFPLEIEVVSDPSGKLLISGLWHSETMWFWQPRARD